MKLKICILTGLLSASVATTFFSAAVSVGDGEGTGSMVMTGTIATAVGDNDIVIGNGAKTSVGAALGDNVVIGTNASATGGRNIAINGTATMSLYGRGSSIAVGGTATEAGITVGGTATNHGVSMGQTANAGTEGTAIGFRSRGGTQGTAVGNYATAEGVQAAAFGSLAKASGTKSITIGASSEVSGNSSAAIGTGNVVKKNNTVVLGNQITATQDNSVILGNASTDRAATTEAHATIGGLTYGDFAGQGDPKHGVVSVGAENNERQVVNVAAGSISATSTDAVNGSQLYAVANTLSSVVNSTVSVLGGNAAVDANGKISMSNIGNTGANTLHDAIKAAYDKEASVVAGSANVSVTNTAKNDTGGTEYVVDIAKDLSLNSVQAGNTTINSEGLSIQNGPSVTTDGIDGANKKITNVAAGTNDADAVNVAQLKAAKSNVAAGDHVTVIPTTNEDNSTTYTVSVVTDGKVEDGNTGIVTGGTVYEETRVKQDGSYIQADNTAGENLAALDRQVKKNDDAITQIGNQVTHIGDRIDRMDSRVDRVGAGAAALAALHPQDYDPEAKWDFAAGYGRYKDANALAVGAFYRPNDATMFSISGSMGGGEDMMNVGLSLKVGHRSEYAGYSKAALTSVISQQKEQIANLTTEVAGQKQENQELKAQVQNQKAQITSQQKQIEDILQRLEALKK